MKRAISSGKGMIALMGSGELTATMVEVHKEILTHLGSAAKAVFLDTPAGFQLNAGEISQRAVEYFRVNVGSPLSVVSFRSREIPPLDAEQAFRLLRESDFVLVGPGSPTYALRQWQGTPIPEILKDRIVNGACLVAASAAALTVGRFTLPVYEIYKVGEELRWAEGLDILGRFGLDAVVIPHWNNAEGGTHDTRFCFMGESRFRKLTSLLPHDHVIIGLDEHTACILDLKKEEGYVRGIGSVTVRSGDTETIIRKGQRFPLALLLPGGSRPAREIRYAEPPSAVSSPAGDVAGFWDTLHTLQGDFDRGLNGDAGDATRALLELDKLIWEAQQEMENPEFILQGREILRECVVLLGTRLAAGPRSRHECLAPLVEALLALRASFRKNTQWREADAIRDCLMQAGIEIEDTQEGYRWRLSA
jgi:peptidase E